MKIESNRITVHHITNDSGKKSKQQQSLGRCPFCGAELKQINGSNIKICPNQCCERSQSFYRFV